MIEGACFISCVSFQFFLLKYIYRFYYTYDVRAPKLIPHDYSDEVYNPICMLVHTNNMARKSIVKTLIDNYTNKEVTLPSSPIQYLILYRFDSNPSPRFYEALEGLDVFFEIVRVQNGVLMVETLNIANLVVNLIGRYMGVCRLFTGSEVPLQLLVDNFGKIDWSGTGLRT